MDNLELQTSMPCTPACDFRGFEDIMCRFHVMLVAHHSWIKGHCMHKPECIFTNTDGIYTPRGCSSLYCACCRLVIGICPASLATCHTERSRSLRTSLLSRHRFFCTVSALFWAAGDHTFARSCWYCGQRFQLTILSRKWCICQTLYVCLSSIRVSNFMAYAFVQIMSTFSRLQAPYTGHHHPKL